MPDKKLKDLREVLNDIALFITNEKMSISGTRMKLSVWYATNMQKCTPIIGAMEVQFNVPEEIAYYLLRRINSYAPILNITIKNKIFHVSKMEAYANKPCEAC
jgi:hypothetical protein